MNEDLARANAVFEQAAEHRARLSADPHRPRYHFMPPMNWLNDPNGMIHWRGQYHMFYQYNPAGAFHGTIHWGHAVSEDLVHWKDLPIAMAPDTPADYNGCWSGCAVDNNGVPTLIYSGAINGKYQVACVATGDSELGTITKYSGNPVIAAPPADLDLLEFRDHCVWREHGAWYQIIGSGIRNVGGTALLYRSMDLLNWEYLHPLCVGDANQREPYWSGIMWECPQLLALPGGHALVMSAWNHNTLYTLYLSGEYRDLHFTINGIHKVDYGDNFFYAPQALTDASGRCLMWGWLQEGRSREAQIASEWSGVMSLPRLVMLLPDGRLGFEPAPELLQLRGTHTALGECELQPGAGAYLTSFQSDSFELIATFAPQQTGQTGLLVRVSPDGTEQTRIGYDWATGELFMDRTRSTLDPDAAGDRRSGPLAIMAGEPLVLRIYVDRSAIEVFANGRACITGRSYPSRSNSTGVDLFASEPGHLIGLDFWEIGSIW